MNERIAPISEMQKEFAQLPEQFEAGLDIVTVTQNDKPVMTILPYDTYQSLRKTIDYLERFSKNLSAL